MPLVSVNIITKDRAKYLSQAIDSVLAQSFSDWELVIVDDGSTDDTERIIDEYLSKNLPIKFVKNEKNLGIVKSRNLALRQSSGKYIAVLDSDDFWLDGDKLKKQVEFLEKNPEYVLCGTAAEAVDEQSEKIGKIVNALDDGKIRKKILSRNQFVHSSVFFKKSTAEESDGYADYKIGEDYDLFLKMGLRGKMINLSDLSTAYRRHSGGATRAKFLSAKEHWRIIKKYRGSYPNFLFSTIKAFLRILVKA